MPPSLANRSHPPVAPLAFKWRSATPVTLAALERKEPKFLVPSSTLGSTSRNAPAAANNNQSSIMNIPSATADHYSRPSPAAGDLPGNHRRSQPSSPPLGSIISMSTFGMHAAFAFGTCPRTRTTPQLIHKAPATGAHLHLKLRLQCASGAQRVPVHTKWPTAPSWPWPGRV
ncbi:hypothetical protein L227DRAFT_657784 [Lentinus tigrinus ALCF2SS1-6]|uniref:Uncharacterized protein n=1 Tax=Lentinus tigrinus ALCF2SS1-6 TaxID=1328759 RepID=A0A5C2RU48_9APHY|nr:hypothetical protein L227DRAFT_657784 [Lentinus tigrinus ALCF2SS1-6]